MTTIIPDMFPLSDVERSDPQERRRVRRDAARRYAGRVIAAFRPTCIILHGSVARGTDAFESDVDVVVIGGKLPQDFLERLQSLLALNDSSVPIEPLAYTEQEFERMLRRRHVTALDALHFGIPLHGQAYFEKLCATFDQMVAQGLRRTECTWTMQRTLA